MIKLFRRTLCVILILIAALLAGCSSEVTYNQTVIEKFTEALSEQDFAKAHEYFWPYAKHESSEVFAEECQYIIDKLGVTDIAITNVNIRELGEEHLLEYGHQP